ncbi:MAG: hypothetical protein EOO60_12810, partial [Hymenobacter sp.]
MFLKAATGLSLPLIKDINFISKDMRIPPEIEAFITQAIEVGQSCLPDHYPTAAKFNDFQAGYRYDANSGESLTGEQLGDFQPSWYLVAANYFD